MKTMTLAAILLVLMLDCPTITRADEPQTLTVAAAVSSGAAADIAAKATGGKVLSVDSAGGVYLVKVLLGNGQVKIVKVDAATGAIR